MGRLSTAVLIFFAVGAFFVPLVLRMWWVPVGQTANIASQNPQATAQATANRVAVPPANANRPSTDWASLWTQVIDDRAPTAVPPAYAAAPRQPILTPQVPTRLVPDDSQVSQANWLAPATLPPVAPPAGANPGWLDTTDNQHLYAQPADRSYGGATSVGTSYIGTTQDEFGKFLIKLLAATAGVLTLCVVALRTSKSFTTARSNTKRDLVIADAIAVSRDAGVKLIRIGNHQVVVGHDRNGLRGMVLLPAAFGSVLEDLRDVRGTQDLYDGPISAIYSRERRQSFSQPEDQGWDLSQPIS